MKGRNSERLSPSLYRSARRAVAGGHHRHPFVHHQRGEQAGHDRGVGGVVDHHLVKREAADIGGDPFCHAANRPLCLLLALLADQAIHFQHELVEMHPALFRNVQRGHEQVHQHRFAAPDAAPHVDALRTGLPAAEELRQQPARPLRLQFLLQPVQPQHRRALVGIGLQFPGGDQPLVPRGKPAQIARSTCIFLISAIARAGLSPLGQTLAQFMMVWQR